MRHLVKFLALLALILLLIPGFSLAKKPQLARLGNPEAVENANLSAPLCETPFPFPNDELDQYLGDTVLVGRTAYDCQHNATIGRMIQYNPNYDNGSGIIYVSYTDLPFNVANPIRKVKLQKILFDNGEPHAVIQDGGDIVNDGHWGGFTTLAMNPLTPTPRPVPLYHARLNANANYFTRAAVEWSIFPGIYIETAIPYEAESQLIWPKSAMDGDSIVHVLSKDDGTAGIFYARLRYDPEMEMFSITNPNGEIENVTDLAPFISAEIACSPDGQRVVICQPVKRVHIIPGLDDLENDKDYLYWDNNDRGRNWAWGLENAVDITNFQGPFRDLLPDTTAANGDTFRLWLESQIYLDYDNVLHAAFSASEYFILDDQGYIFSQIYYWNEEDHYMIRIGNGNFWNNQTASLGVNNVLVQRPSLYKDPETDWIWCVFQQFGVPGDTTEDGDARDVNIDGRPNAELFITASPVGEFGRGAEMNGKLWFKPINITNSRSDAIAVPAGQCQSERDPSMALNNDGDYLNIGFLVDLDAGMAIATTPEGVSTDNPFVYQRISKQELMDRFMEQREWIPGYPLHVDSVDFWQDPADWAWEAEPPPEDLIVQLQGNYFELVSTHLVPPNLNAVSVFGEIAHLEIVYQDNGRIFIPPTLNTIGNINMTEGYQIYCSSPSQWIVSGQLADPTMLYTLIPRAWNWISYPFDHPIPLVQALAELDGHLEIIMRDDGGLYIPPIINTIGNMQSGVGYFVFTNSQTTITFHYTNPGGRLIRDNTQDWIIPEVEDAPQPTGLPYAVLIRMTDALKSQNPATIELYDNTLLVGKAVVLEDHDITPVIAWGGSEEYNVTGFTPGEVITVQVKAVDGGLLANYADDRMTFGRGAYTDLTLDALNSELPIEFGVDYAYPNPFNPTVTVPFSLPSNGEVRFAVFNLLGEQVYKAAQQFQAGHHRFVFDTRPCDVGYGDLASGVYFLQVQFNGRVNTQKILLMK